MSVGAPAVGSVWCSLNRSTGTVLTRDLCKHLRLSCAQVLYLLVALVCLGPASLITSQFSMCLDAVLLNFYEDIERNSSTGDVFMPEEFRRCVVCLRRNATALHGILTRFVL